MGLKINYINQEAPAPKVQISERLWETADRKRLVPDGHPEAAFLFCAPGQIVSQADLQRLDLDESLEIEVEEVGEAREGGAEGEQAVEGEPSGDAPSGDESPKAAARKRRGGR